MNTSLNTVRPTVSIDTQYVSEEALQQAGAEQDIRATPEQPLFGSVVSLTALWRMVREQLTLVADATSGTAKESNESKKALIDLQRETQIKDLENRERNLVEQKKQATTMQILGGIMFGLTLLAAIIMMPFNPVMAAIMIGTLVASIVIPIVVDKILEAVGVDKVIRDKVKMGLEISIALLGALLTFNPFSAIKNIATAVGQAVKSGAQAAAAGLRSLPQALANINWGQVGKSAGEAAAKAGAKIAEMATELAKTMQAFFRSLASGSRSAATSASSFAEKWANLKIIVQATAYTVGNAMKTAGTAAKEGLKAAFETLRHADEILQGAMTAMRSAGQRFVEIMRSFGTKLQTFGHAMKSAPAQTLKTMMNDFLDWVAKVATTFDKASAVQINRVIGVTTGVTGVVQTGFSVASASIARDTEVAGARFEEVNTVIQEVLNQLNAAMRLFQQALESLSTLNSDYREFTQEQIAIHL